MNGRPATSTIALGTVCVMRRSRVASPPASTATGTSAIVTAHLREKVWGRRAPRAATPAIVVLTLRVRVFHRSPHAPREGFPHAPREDYDVRLPGGGLVLPGQSDSRRGRVSDSRTTRASGSRREPPA